MKCWTTAAQWLTSSCSSARLQGTTTIVSKHCPATNPPSSAPEASIYTFKFYYRSTHLSSWDILKLFSAVSGWLSALTSLVGAGRDGFVHLQVPRGCAELKAAVAGFTNASRVEKLLAWHRDLLVTATGAKHVTTVPAEDREEFTVNSISPTVDHDFNIYISEKLCEIKICF